MPLVTMSQMPASGMSAYVHHLVYDSFQKLDERLEREEYYRFIRHVDGHHTDHSGCDQCCT